MYTVCVGWVFWGGFRHIAPPLDRLRRLWCTVAVVYQSQPCTVSGNTMFKSKGKKYSRLIYTPALVILSSAFFTWTDGLEIFANPLVLFLAACKKKKKPLSAIILRKCLFNISEIELHGRLGLFCWLWGGEKRRELWFKRRFLEASTEGAGKKSQQGLLNYTEVQHSVTSRQALRTLPTEVFLCGWSAGVSDGWLPLPSPPPRW